MNFLSDRDAPSIHANIPFALADISGISAISLLTVYRSSARRYAIKITMPEMLSGYYDSALSCSLAIIVFSIKDCIARMAVPFGWVMSLLVLLHRPART